ncbi:MAG: gliding motility-associated C-terminal domain-containing protein [Bacteroidales bacterium]|nr:gliding motility-associated C-terminal domain-containing protein [Bacteroidales bacterium]
MKKNIILSIVGLLFSLSFSQVSAQCTVTADAYPLTVCSGDPVSLTAAGSCGYLMYNDFNNGTAGAGWVATTGVDFSNPCNPTSDGTIYMWMGSSVPIPRTLTTIDFNVDGACEISFDLKYATQSQSSPCEGIDEMDEGITLQYSTNSGGTWVDIAYFRADGVILATAIAPGSNNTSITNYNTPFTVWDNYSFPVPPAAQTPSTRFRWIQQAYSSQSNDHWGLDNIEIVCPSNVQVDWAHGATGFNPPTVYPVSDTTYIVTILDTVSGQWAIDSVSIDVKPIPTSDFTVESPICSDELSTIEYTGTGSTASSFNWLFSGGTIASGSGAGPYELSWPVGGLMYVSLEVTDSGCTSPVTYDSVLVYTAPQISFTVDDQDGCEPHNVQFTDNSFPAGSIWDWDLGDGNSSTDQNPTHTYTADGSYSVSLILTTAEGCDDTLTMPNYITVYPSPVAYISADPISTTIVSPEITFSSTSTGVDTWYWTFGDGTNSSSPPDITHEYLTDGTFSVWLFIESVNGCRDSAYVNVEILAEPYFFNIITPNSDGRNDTYVVQNGERLTNELTVFNRWGKKVFEATNYQNDWDGGDLADGTYYIIYLYGNELENEYHGTLTILRQ